MPKDVRQSGGYFCMLEFCQFFLLNGAYQAAWLSSGKTLAAPLKDPGSIPGPGTFHEQHISWISYG